MHEVQCPSHFLHLGKGPEGGMQLSITFTVGVEMHLLQLGLTFSFLSCAGKPE